MLAVMPLCILICGCGVNWRFWERDEQAPPPAVAENTADDSEPTDEDQYPPDDDEQIAESTPTDQPPSEEVDQDDVSQIRSIRINNEELTIEQFLEPLMPELRRRAREDTHLAYETFLRKALVEELRDRMRNMLIYQEAAKKLTDQEFDAFDQFVDKEVKRRINADFGGRQSRFEEHLRSLNLNIEDVRERYRRQMIVEKYLHDNVWPLVTEPRRWELANFYEQNIAEFAQPHRAELFLIEIPIDDFLDTYGVQPAEEQTAAARRAAREHAEQILTEIDGGGDFGELAGKYSKGIHAADGGAWGYISPPGLKGKWGNASDVLFTLQSDELGGIVEGGGSFFIVKAGQVAAAEQTSFIEIQHKLKARYRQQQFQILSGELAERIRRKATIHPSESNFLLAAYGAVPEHESLTPDPAAAEP